jgi:putative phage-type endonuclease
MKIHNVQQGSQDWHALRDNHYTASEAPAMARVSKYLSRADLLKQKYSGEIPEVSDAQQRLFDKGHAAEAKARHIAEELIGEELYPATATSEDHPHLLASFDGCTMLEDVIWETKLWNQDLAAAVRAEVLSAHYLVQMDQQLLVSGAEKCLFMCSDGTRENTVWCWHYPDEARFQRLIAGWQRFRQDLADYQPTADDEVARAKVEAQQDAVRAHEAEAASWRACFSLSAAERGAALKTAREVENPDNVTISRKEYNALLAARVMLDALQSAGVEEWSGYEDAITEL